MQNVTSAILQKLEDAACSYELLEHHLVFTMDDVEKHICVPIESRVKTMVVATQGPAGLTPILCGLQATARLDIKKVAGLIGLSRSKVSMMSPEAAEDVLAMPRGAIGLIAPFFSPHVILSQFFKYQPYVCFGVGRNDRTLKISIENLRKVTQVNFADIEKKGGV